MKEGVMGSCALHLFGKRVIRSIVSRYMARCLKSTTGPKRRISHHPEDLDDSGG